MSTSASQDPASERESERVQFNEVSHSVATTANTEHPIKLWGYEGEGMEFDQSLLPRVSYRGGGGQGSPPPPKSEKLMKS